MMRLINLKLLRIYGKTFPYYISFSKGPFLSTLAMERDRIGHQITMFCWENGLLF